MRVAIVTESFLPQVNGVTNTVRHVVDHLLEKGHQVLVVAPGDGPGAYRGVPVVRARAVGLPGYRSFPIGLPDAAVLRALAGFRPDVVHLASPIALGAVGLRAAVRLGVPTVAVYQTDVVGFAQHYGVRVAAPIGRWVGRLHRRCDRTLVPSTTSLRQLEGLGVGDLHLWRRGVALHQFDPAHRDHALRRQWLRDGDELLVGYVGRLAAEKQVARLAELADLPGVRLVVVGDGPERAALARQLPGAVFAGMLHGEELARAFAVLDVFVHPGEHETFCQTVQEAQASGVPVVAPASGGPLDLVEHGRTGLLYDPAVPTSLRGALEALTRHSLLRHDVAAAGLAAVAGRSWSAVCDELVEHHYAAVVRPVDGRHRLTA